MADRPSRRTRLVLPALVLGLLLTGCSDGGQEADDPAPAPSSSPTESGTTPASDEPCDAIDRAALTELAGLEFDEVEPYEEGGNHADGCFLSSREGDLSVIVDIRDQHGDLETDLDDFAGLPRRATPEPATIAGQEALTATGPRGAGVTVSAVALHLEDDRLVLVSVMNILGADLTGEGGVDLATAIAEMVVPVL